MKNEKEKEKKEKEKERKPSTLRSPAIAGFATLDTEDALIG